MVCLVFRSTVFRSSHHSSGHTTNRRQLPVPSPGSRVESMTESYSTSSLDSNMASNTSCCFMKLARET